MIGCGIVSHITFCVFVSPARAGVDCVLVLDWDLPWTRGHYTQTPELQIRLGVGTKKMDVLLIAW